ncbi:Epoxide Hydrolase For Polyether [Sesbania bispinosa]|nr:Epoxide Hydrolase For Polyether [Sesbania bispinosa]
MEQGCEAVMGEGQSVVLLSAVTSGAGGERQRRRAETRVVWWIEVGEDASSLSDSL